jgi:hypothetical protein
MKDGILIFLLVFLFGVWIFLYVRRAKEKKRKQREMSEILKERLGNKAISFVREGRKASIMKEIGDLPRAFRSFQRSVYPYSQKERRSGKERRKSRVQIGLIFEYIDRRQSNSTRYTEPDRRSGNDRRGKYWDRRQPQVVY